MPAILQTAPFGRSGTLPDRGRMIPATAAGPQPLPSRLQLEPDHVAGTTWLRSRIPVDGQGVEQLEAAPGHRDRPIRLAVERMGCPAVVDLDMEQVRPEGHS